MKKHIIYTSLFLTLLSIWSCSSNHEKNKNILEIPPVQVQIGKVAMTSKSSHINASGTIQASKQTNISTRMMGYVESIHVNIGDPVKKGQLLLSINSKDLSAKQNQVKASISEAKAGLNSAEKDYNRYKALFKTESASQKELDDMTTHFTMAKARLEQALQMQKEVEAQLEYTNIVAPFSGIVASKFINQGDMANPGMPLISLENNHSFDVVTMVSEEDISHLKINQDVSVHVKSNGKIINGKIKEIGRSTKHFGSQFPIKIQLDDSKDLYTGMYVQVIFPQNGVNKNEQIILPKSILINRGQLNGIYVISQQNTAVLRWLRLGKETGDHVEVISGLNPGDQYIKLAKGKIENGTPLTFLK